MRFTRRQFLGTIAAGAAGAAGLAAAHHLPGAIRPLLADDDDLPLPSGPRGDRSKLVSVVNPIVVKGELVNEKYLAQMLDMGLTRFFGADDHRQAWGKLIGPGQKVLIKLNRSGADGIATTAAMVHVLLASLESAGVPLQRVMLLDVAPQLHRECGTCPPIIGYCETPVTVLGREEHLAAALNWADCLINVPFIKDHHLVGVTCGMKNLSHGLIKAPARWHGDRCRESIPHLFNLEPIRSKLKLTVCNALRVVFDGGPEARPECLAENSRLLFATDVVALDAYAARLIDQVRGAHGLKDLAEEHRPPSYLAVARDLGLGQPDLDRVDVTELET